MAVNTEDSVLEYVASRHAFTNALKLDYTCGLERIYTREEIANAKKFPSSGENTTYNILALSVIRIPFGEHSFHCWESTTKIWVMDYLKQQDDMQFILENWSRKFAFYTKAY